MRVYITLASIRPRFRPSLPIALFAGLGETDSVGKRNASQVLRYLSSETLGQLQPSQCLPNAKLKTMEYLWGSNCLL